MNSIKVNQVLDAKGMACPMPIVKTKKAIRDMASGEILEVQATDKGSTADLKAWAASSGHQYIGTLNEGSVFKHYLRKSGGEEYVEKTLFPSVSNEELHQKLQASEEITLLDVREEAEFAFEHIPGAVSIPLGELIERKNELNGSLPIYVVCRTGSRSEMAARMLADKGFSQVINVVPGMSGWNGEKTSL
ncbi:hypothetical protein GJU40_17465 [Bacillus lacus]|uniref:Rhodanese domain-containing protein n=1 Tax=Metabacillus lacus TaxID=1983721 RepID=A0A7X2LYU2_9BACI|nr:sulfurtransferase TusA family protein [Metabacillus lacus]MRX73925.1 hypothetical protein [Metabacillus lacus]